MVRYVGGTWLLHWIHHVFDAPSLMTLSFRRSMLVGYLIFLLSLQLVTAAPETKSDPFRALALRRPKEPEPPICCLRPLPPAQPEQEDDLLLSFEDWKAKRLASQDNASATAASRDRTPRPGQAGKEANGEHTSDPPSRGDTTNNGGGPDDGTHLPPLGGHDAYTSLPAHFRVPLTDRFNFAAVDCSARVHASHRAAKSASAILTAKKDRYMLAPCAARGTHVVVELCDDIRIDTVQLANFEFFSGVFKDLRVSVAKTYTTDPRGWTDAGTYRAKNVRGVQSFHPPTSLRDFYRYIRIDFLSHYGNEYYCPVSLLRVFGLTHLDEWKWEAWEAESRERLAAPQDAAIVVVALPVVPLSAEPKTPGSNETPSSPSQDTASPHQTGTTKTTREAPAVAASIALPSSVPATAVSETPSSAATPTQSLARSIEGSANRSEATSGTPTPYLETVTPVTTTAYVSASASATSKLSAPVPLSSEEAQNKEKRATVPPGEDPLSNSQSTSLGSIAVSNLPTLVPTVTTLLVTSANAPPVQSPITGSNGGSGGGESIYRTIMNRLAAAERNATLYARYVEEHTAGVREALRRMGEDVGRLEAVTRAQAQTLQRSLSDMERQRQRIEDDHGELLRRVAYLSDEVMLERRLGIAQLCLMLAVLVFMALTRGSRADAPIPRNNTPTATRGWRRNLNLSSDWVSRLRTRSVNSQDKYARRAAAAIDTTPFPSSRTLVPRTPSVESIAPRSPLSPVSPAPRSSRPRTSSHKQQGPSRGTPRRPPPPIRTHSHGGTPTLASSTTLAFAGLGPVPRSARRWARSAHLHEVRGRSAERRAAAAATGGDENAPGDALRTAPAREADGKMHVRGRARRPLVPLTVHIAPPATAPILGGFKRRGPNGNAKEDEDAWVDTDAGASGASDGDDVFS